MIHQRWPADQHHRIIVKSGWGHPHLKPPWFHTVFHTVYHGFSSCSHWPSENWPNIHFQWAMICEKGLPNGHLWKTHFHFQWLPNGPFQIQESHRCFLQTPRPVDVGGWVWWWRNAMCRAVKSWLWPQPQGGQHDRHEGMMGFVGKIIGNPMKMVIWVKYNWNITEVYPKRQWLRVCELEMLARWVPWFTYEKSWFYGRNCYIPEGRKEKHPQSGLFHLGDLLSCSQINLGWMSIMVSPSLIKRVALQLVGLTPQNFTANEVIHPELSRLVITWGSTALCIGDYHDPGKPQQSRLCFITKTVFETIGQIINKR